MSITNLTNTRWRFPETVDFSALPFPESGYKSFSYSIRFSSGNATNNTNIQITRTATGVYSISYSYSQRYLSSRAVPWSSNQYREIYITGGNAVQNAELISWLEAAAELIDRYYIDKSDLVSVADAIRTKGGISAELEFPSGFVTAINDITTPIPSNYGLITYNGSILTVS